MLETDSSSSSPPVLNVEADPRSPFYLTTADHPSVLFVSEKLHTSNYHSWSRSTFLSLKARNKLGFIDGSLHPPAQTDSLFSSWSKCDTIVLSWLLNSLSPKIAQSVIYIDTSRAMWLELKERFSQGNGPRVLELQTAISALRQNQSHVSTYFTELKVLWDELLYYQPLPMCICRGCTCNSSKTFVAYHHQSYVMTFLMGLTDVFDAVRGQILMMEPLPSINKVFSLVIQEERQRLLSQRHSPSISVESVALATKSDTVVRNFKLPTRSKVTCSHCGISGHTVDRCYKIHGYPPNYKFRDKTKGVNATANAVQNTDLTSLSLTTDQCQQLLALLKTSCFLLHLLQ
ncbi:uncharacterized protein LOC122276877 [Carya illinoinensis]|uniref:uncharacterized protein LOC122276877 n=1 Tax=Carya illinoinensis TaxID=32201 RepID=UPI001C72588A|nr:uncharacterized protein LOC122276877 [Carya illinoinensis]